MFDYLGIFYISDLLRKVKGWFQIPENYDKEVKWIDEMDEMFNNHDFLLQESIFLRELFIERAIEGKLGQTVKPLYSGPKNWKEKLRDAGYQHWTIQKEMHERYLNQPDGPISRQYDISLSRKDQILANNPAKYLSQKRLVQLCKARGGCCARSCQCCLKPRGLYPDKSLYYAHCSLGCGCCVRHENKYSARRRDRERLQC